MIALSFVVLALASIHWVLIGYSLAFGPDVGGIIGNLNYLGLHGVSRSRWKGYSPLVFMIFQLFFAAVTITIVTSAVAERIKFSSFIVLCCLATVVYCPLAHWAWGGGWAQQWDLSILPGERLLRYVRVLPRLRLHL